jgi:hypothetical protein
MSAFGYKEADFEIADKTLQCPIDGFLGLLRLVIISGDRKKSVALAEFRVGENPSVLLTTPNKVTVAEMSKIGRALTKFEEQIVKVTGSLDDRFKGSKRRDT